MKHVRGCVCGSFSTFSRIFKKNVSRFRIYDTGLYLQFHRTIISSCGSMIVVLFEKGMIHWDEDLLINGRASSGRALRNSVAIAHDFFAPSTDCLGGRTTFLSLSRLLSF